MFSNFEIVIITLSSIQVLLLILWCCVYLFPLIRCLFFEEDKESKKVKKFHNKKVNMKEFNKMRADIQHIDEVLCNIDNNIEFLLSPKFMEKNNGKSKHTN